MSEDYEVGITLALTDYASVGIAAVQRDLLRLDQVMAQSAMGLAELRAAASIALKDADVDVRRAAGLAAAPAPRTAVQPTKVKAPADEMPAIPNVVQMAPMASVVAAAAPVKPMAAPMPIPRVTTNEVELEGTIPVAPVALPPMAAPAAPTAEPARREIVALPAAPTIPSAAVEVDRARSTRSAVAAAPIALALPSAPSALPPTPLIAPAAPDAAFAARPAAPIAPAPIGGRPLVHPAAPTVTPMPVLTEARSPSAPTQQRFAAPLSTVERVTTRDMPRMPELAAIGRATMPSRPMEGQRAPIQQVSLMGASPDTTAFRPAQGLSELARPEDPRDGRMQGAPLDEPRRHEARSEAAQMPVAAAYAPAAPAAMTREQPTMSGDVILDGQKVGRWMSDRMTRDAGRPPNGPTGFDPSRSPPWPGATVA